LTFFDVMSVGSMPARGQVFSTPPKEVLDAYSSPRTTRGAAAMPLHFCHPNTPHRKLRMPEWFISSLMMDRALDAVARRAKTLDRKHDIPYLAGYELHRAVE
jgi:hypothetical protein